MDAASAAARQRVRHPRLGLLAIGLGVLAPAMDTSVNIAMPSITAAFALEQRAIQWIVTCYMLVYGALMLTCGKLGDLYGHRRIFQMGQAVTAVAFAVCALATAYPVLLAGRALQGLGIALSLSCGPALATQLYPDSRRTWVLGLYGSIFALGTALGPVVGGWLIAQGSWSLVFAFRVPLVLAALALSGLLPAGRTLDPRAAVATASFDWIGAALLIGWMSALMLAFSGPHYLVGVPDWLPDGVALGWTLAGLGGAGIIAFLAHEARHAEPIIRPALFRSASFSALNAAALMVNLAGFAVLIIAPYYLTKVAQLPVETAGLVLATSGAGTMLGSWLAGRAATPSWSRIMIWLGIGASAAGLLAISQWQADTGLGAMTAGLLVQGFGVGLFQVAYTDSVIARLPPQDRGVAGSLTMMVRTLGIIGGATGLSALFQHLEISGRAAGQPAATAFLDAFQSTFAICGGGLLAGCMLAGLAALILRPRSRP